MPPSDMAHNTVKMLSKIKGINARPVRIFACVFMSFFVVYSFLKKIERNPHYAVTFYKMAKECENRCRGGKRKYYYRKVIYHDPTFSDAYYQLASMSEQEGNADVALQFYQKVTELDSTNHKAYFKIAIDYFQNSEFVRAARYFQQAMKHYPHKSHEAHCYLGRVYEMWGNYGDATRQYRNCISSDNEYMYEVYLKAGVGFYKLGNNRIALWYVRNLREQKRDDLADQLKQYMETGQYPEYLTRIDLTK